MQLHDSEERKGNISLADLERVAKSHDFVWSKEEFQDMINIFDSNKDGHVSEVTILLILYFFLI